MKKCLCLSDYNEPWQRAFANEWDGSPAMNILLKERYIRYCQELGVPVAAVSLTSKGKILKQNLLSALLIAIEVQTQREKTAGYTGDSALVDGWKTNVATLLKGGTLEVR